MSKRARVEVRLALSFSDKDKVGTIQPYDDTLVVTLKIGGYDVKKVMVDQGSGAEVMYPDLYKRLNLKSEDLTAYDSPLISFDGKVFIPKGQIRLLVQAESEVVEVNFIMVDTYSPYTAIVGRPWFHALGAVSSTLHLKVEYQSRTKSKSSLGISPWLSNAWWPSFCINLGLSPRPLPRQAHSNQRPRCHLIVSRPKRRNMRVWRRLL